MKREDEPYNPDRWGCLHQILVAAVAAVVLLLCL